MPVDCDRGIAELLRTARRIALLGASANPVRPSHEVMRFLLASGYAVVQVNPALAGEKLLGQRVYAALGEIPGRLDMVDVFRAGEHLPGIVDECLACQVPALWTQLGVVDEAAARRAEAAGLQVVMDRCPAIEWPRLRRQGLLREP